MSLFFKDLIDVFFIDESGFSLQPNIPYAWQPIGVQWGIPSEKNKVLNVLGFLNPKSQQLVTYPMPEGAYMDSELFISYVEDFATKIVKETVIIVDRAPWHTSWAVLDKLSTWANQGLHLFYLPPYCPHLNLIETLWRKIKNEWLSIKDYHSKNTLKKKLFEIFNSYGNQYNIEFSMNIFRV